MSFSFPPNPTEGQTYSNNGVTWQWNGIQWVSTKTPTGKTAPVYISVSPPPSPVAGSLWYDSNNASLNIYYTDQNGSQWIAVTPFPQDSIDQNGGIFQGAIYAQYEIPNNPAAFVTAGWFETALETYLSEKGYARAGADVTLNSEGEIIGINSSIVTP
jgi:hypothetical protein